MIIGLCGPEGAGKSTAATILSGKYGLPVKPFAGPLKAMLVAMGVPKRNLYGSPEDKAAPLEILGGKSARGAMQTLGTEWGRRLLADDLWIRAWKASLPSDGVIADDLRFPNEAQAIRELGGTIICIVRSMEDSARTPKHASENFQAITPDHIVVNDGDQFDLRIKLVRALTGTLDLLRA